MAAVAGGEGGRRSLVELLRLEFWRVVRSASENSPCGAPKEGREGDQGWKCGGNYGYQGWRGEHRQPGKGGPGEGWARVEFLISGLSA